MSEFTDNFNLDLYKDNEPANLSDQYNDAMHKIDTALYDINNVARNALKKINDEENRAKAAESLLNNNLSNEETRAKAAEEVLSNNLSSETARAKAAEEVLSNNLSSETARAKAAEEVLSNNLSKLSNILSNDTLKKPKYIACIGDSYGQGLNSSDEKTKNPFAIMGNILNAEIYSIADGGSGFHAVGNDDGLNYKNQIKRLSQQIDNNKITHVFITGGRNDVNQNSSPSSNYIDEVRETIKEAHNDFPNAKIVVYTLQWDANPAPSKMYQYQQIIHKGCIAENVRFVDYGYTVLRGEYDKISGDNAHPNDEGYKLLGEMYAAVLQGSDGEKTKIEDASFDGLASYGSGVNFCSYHNGVISLSLDIKPKTGHGNWSANETIAVLPKFVKPSDGNIIYITAETTGSQQILLTIDANQPSGYNAAPTLKITNNLPNNDGIMAFVTLPFGR